jgi:sulfur carrier protein
MGNKITFVCNGVSRSCENGSTIGTLLCEKKIDPASVVVEINRDIIQKEKFVATALKNNDSVEILHFVGGG